MLEEEVCNFKLFVDYGNHVWREVIHGALNIDIFSILWFTGQELDHPFRKFNFILPNCNVETRIRPVVLRKQLSSIRKQNLKDFYVSIISYKVHWLGEGPRQLATALGLFVVFVAGKHKFKYFCVPSPCSPLDRTHALCRWNLALDVEVSAITPQLLENMEVVESDGVENGCDSIITLLFIYIYLLFPSNSFVDCCFELLIILIVFQGILSL